MQLRPYLIKYAYISRTQNKSKFIILVILELKVFPEYAIDQKTLLIRQKTKILTMLRIKWYMNKPSEYRKEYNLKCGVHKSL